MAVANISCYCMKILSIVLPNNDTKRLLPFLDSMIDKFDDYKNIEVCIAHGSNVTDIKIDKIKKSYPFTVKFSYTEYG